MPESARLEIAVCVICGCRLSRIAGEKWRHNYGPEGHPAKAKHGTVRDLRAAIDAEQSA